MAESRMFYINQSDTMIEGMTNNNHGDYWQSVLANFKEVRKEFGDSLTKRENDKTQRMILTKALSQAEDDLIAILDKTNKAVLSVFSIDSPEYHDFYKSGTYSNLVNSKMREMAENARYLLAGVKKYVEKGINQSFADKLEIAIKNFEKALLESNNIKSIEKTSIDNLKKLDDEFISSVKRTALYIKSVVPQSEWHLYGL